MNRELIERLRKVNFSWCLSKNDVWNSSFPDIEGINSRIYDFIDAALRRLEENPSEAMLGKIILGQQGAGKTHFIASLRRRISPDITFIYADMTGIKDFWRTLLHEFLSSLRNKTDGVEQSLRILSSFLGESEKDKCVVASLAEIPLYEKKIQSILYKSDCDKAMKYRDVVRAFLLFCSEDFDLKSIGDDWLRGYGTDENTPVKFGAQKSDARDVVLGLTWLASFKGATLFAIDQVDALASEKTSGQSGDGETKDTWLQEALRIKRLIVQSLMNGMASLVTDASRSLVLLTCIDFSLASLREHSLGSALDRFEDRNPILEQLSSVQLMQRLVVSRIAPAFKGLTPPPTKSFPFSPQFFESLGTHTPRQVLQMCERALQSALDSFDSSGNFEEITHFADYSEKVGEQSKIDERYAAEISNENEAKELLDSKDAGEEKIGMLLDSACKWFIEENGLHEKITVERMGENTALHVRALISTGNNSELTVCMRFLMKTQHLSFRKHFENALVASGIDPAIPSRRLAVFSGKDLPEWQSTKDVIGRFQKAQGIFTVLSQKQIAMLLALDKISSMNGFHVWLRRLKPIRLSGIFDEVLNESLEETISPEISKEINEFCNDAPHEVASHTGEMRTNGFQSELNEINKEIPENALPEQLESNNREYASDGLFLGNNVEKQIFLPTKALCEHSVILASSGSGKTVLLRRMIEQAALCGIPSVVIDVANDLARLGIPRPETEDDEYFKKAEVVIWTPGARKGRPMAFPPLPDFSDIVDDKDALTQAVALAEDTLAKYVVTPGGTTRNSLKRGLLNSALMSFARGGYKPKFRLNWFAKESRLSDFIKFLENLPDEALLEIDGAKKLSKEMANIFKSERQRNPDFHDSPPFDFANLLTAKNPGKVRVSVVNLSGMPSVEAQCLFINQLAMNLFMYVRNKPALGGEAQALLVVDEAQEFIPAGSVSTACKTSLLRLVAQGRKYGLGLIFATQNPRNLDYKAMGNIGTYFLGRAQAPNTVKQLLQLIEAWGVGGKRYAVGCLEQGEFYLRSTGGYTEPLKVTVPMCLSFHPRGNPLTHEEIIKLSRNPI